MATDVLRIVVPPEAAGERLDQLLARSDTGLSRTLARKLIELGGVHLDGRRTRRCGQALSPGQRIEVFRDGGSLDPFVLHDEHVLYRDTYLLALNKPAGIETQPTPARYRGTLYAALLDYLHNPYRPLDKPALGMVQRLDRDTSGVMIFSIHARSHKGLSTLFFEHRVAKTYLALVQGRMVNDSGEFRSQLARNRKSNRYHSVASGGKEAVTCFRVLERFREVSLVEVEILTGRTHQIRVHFAEAGHPLLGDRSYGGATSTTGRQMLHAWRIVLPHPVSGEPLTFEAPLPEDMNGVLAALRVSHP